MPTDIDARKYYRVAKQRLTEAKLVLTKAELPAAAQYLGGYAVECILKALLLTLTPSRQRPPAGAATVEWLKREFGHDLIALRAAIRARSGGLPRDVTAEFVYVLTWDPDLRYEPGPVDPGKAERFVAAAEAIVKWADRSI